MPVLLLVFLISKTLCFLLSPHEYENVGTIKLPELPINFLNSIKKNSKKSLLDLLLVKILLKAVRSLSR